MDNKKEEVRPFFANFLEGMEKEELAELKGGKTLKYPSDTDEWPEP